MCTMVELCRTQSMISLLAAALGSRRSTTLPAGLAFRADVRAPEHLDLEARAVITRRQERAGVERVYFCLVGELLPVFFRRGAVPRELCEHVDIVVAAPDQGFR